MATKLLTIIFLFFSTPVIVVRVLNKYNQKLKKLAISQTPPLKVGAGIPYNPVSESGPRIGTQM